MPQTMVWQGYSKVLEHLKNTRRTHATTDAHRDAHFFGTTATAFNQSMASQALAADAVGMADGNGAPVDVQALIRDAEPVPAVNHLHGKSFVELPQVNVVHFQAQTCQHLGDGKRRADAHFIGLTTGHGKAQKTPQRLQTLF